MAHITIHGDTDALSAPFLVEGLPGVGLVGKIATDHLVEHLEMDYFASVHCDGLPRLGVYHEGESEVLPPVRIYHDSETELLALQSEVPISGEAAPEFATCVTGWLSQHDVTPVYLSGRPAERDGRPDLVGIATGTGHRMLDAAGIDEPTETGAVSGPTGALLLEAAETALDSVGLIVESDPQFPDPAASRTLLESGIEPITDVSVDTDHLLEQAEHIREQRRELAERLQHAQREESTQARPIGMYQ